MIAFASDAEYRSRRADAVFWRPYVEGVLERHGLPVVPPVSAEGASYPTFFAGGLVVKFYGHAGLWREAFAAELPAYALLAGDPGIAVPRLVASGELGEAWSYLVMTRVTGTTWAKAGFGEGERLAAARDLGAQIARVHALAAGPGVDRHADWPPLAVSAAFGESALPKHLVAQVDAYVAGLPAPDEVFSHGDLFEGNILVEGGRVTGLIDWGDAMVIDRHNELAKIHLSVFGCDKALLRAFLEGSNWPVYGDFPRRALGAALVRQAVGIAQHGSGFDNFYLVPAMVSGRRVDTLDELARVLFEV